MTRGGACSWLAAAAAAALLAAALPHLVTDGDSCLYAALGRDMAARGGSAWVAPQWAFHGAMRDFHEHPPGAFWVSALVQLAGAPEPRAALAANALWLVAAAAGVVAVARRFLDRDAAAVAGLVFLLHVPVLRYFQRAALEPPLAACAAWSVAAALRLGRHRAWTVVLAAALSGAFLVRGVFGLVPLGLLLWIAADPALRPPLARLALGAALAAVALVAFELAHASATGHGFSPAYLERQVLPSLEPGGTAHSAASRPWAYFPLRLALYSLPWSLVPLFRLARSRGRAEPGPAWRLAGAWVLFVLLGAMATTRPASRYLFLAYPALALLVGLAVAGRVPAWLGRVATPLLLAAVPLGIAAKYALDARDPWWRTAETLRARRAGPGALPAVVRGDLAAEEGRVKSLLRFHLGVPAVSGPPAPGEVAWVYVGKAVEPPAGTRLVLSLPAGGSLHAAE